MDVFLWDWVLLISSGIPSNQYRLLTFLKSSAPSQLEGIGEMQVRVHPKLELYVFHTVHPLSIMIRVTNRCHFLL